MKVDKKSATRVLILGVLTIILALFVIVNSKEFFTAGYIYLAFIGISLLLIRQGSKFFAISDKWISRIFIGGIVGVGFILLSFTGLSIGIPDVPQTIEGANKAIVVAGLAPISEELVFRGVLLGLVNLGLPVVIILPLQALVFSLFHITAYGAFVFNAGAFVGAIVFGIVAGLLTLKYKSIVPAIVAHAIFNGFLLTQLVVAVG